MQILLCSTNEAVKRRWSGFLESDHQLYPISSLEEINTIRRDGITLVVLVHREMVDEDSLAEICRMSGQKLFVLADRPSNQDGLACLQAGCVGYGNTYMSSARLKAAVEAVAGGLAWMGESLMQYLLQGLAQGKKRQPATSENSEANVLASLSTREKEIAMLVADGLSNQAIGHELGITERTVKAHLSAIYTKSGSKGRMELALKINQMTS